MNIFNASFLSTCFRFQSDFQVTELPVYAILVICVFFFGGVACLFLILAVLGFCCFAQAFSSYEWKLLLVTVQRLLIEWLLLLAEHWLQGEWASISAAHRLSNWGAGALERRLSSRDTRA